MRCDLAGVLGRRTPVAGEGREFSVLTELSQKNSTIRLHNLTLQPIFLSLSSIKQQIDDTESYLASESSIYGTLVTTSPTDQQRPEAQGYVVDLKIAELKSYIHQ